MTVLADLVQQSTATTGTGTVTLGAAVTGFRTVAGAGIADGVVVSYAIQDGTNRETGTGTVGGSGTTLTRTLLASSTGSLLNLSGSAVVGIAPNAADFDFSGVTSVGGTGTVSGLTLSGTVTSAGNLTLGGALSVVPANFASQTANTFLAAPNGSAGAPSFRAIVAADIPTLNQSTTGSAATLTTARDIAMTGDVTWNVSFNGSSNVTAAATLSTTARATGKQTIFIPASAMLPRITNGPSLGSLETATNRVNVSTLDFDPATQEFAQFQIAMPKSWDEGTVTYEVIWYHPATTVNFGVVWSLAGVALSDTNALDTAFGTAVQVTDTGGTTNALYDSPESGAVTIGNAPAENDYVIFQIARVPADGSDTMAVDARLLGIRLFYTTNAGNDA